MANSVTILAVNTRKSELRYMEIAYPTTLGPIDHLVAQRVAERLLVLPYNRWVQPMAGGGWQVYGKSPDNKSAWALLHEFAPGQKSAAEMWALHHE